VQLLPDPPNAIQAEDNSSSGAIAQLGERLLCKQEVTGSIPVGSTSFAAFSNYSFMQLSFAVAAAF
jgi:hypothetical protein